jgi:cytochrome c-type biogenesis protein CcmF
VLGLALAAWLLAGTITELAQRIRLFAVPLAESLRRLKGVPLGAWGMTLAHAGFALMIAGMTGSQVWRQEATLVMHPGTAVAFAGFEVGFDGVASVPGPNYIAERGRFTIRNGQRIIAQLEPEKRRYPVEGRETTEAAIRTTAWGDLYLAVGDARDDGARVVRLYFNPLMLWLWFGAAVMVAGGGLSVLDRRLRLGAPKRVRTGAVPAAARP